MTTLPLPSTAQLKAAANLAPQPISPYASTALRWLRHKLDPLDFFEEEESPCSAGDDSVTRKHEAEERRRMERPPEMSRISVPVLPHEQMVRVKEKDKGNGRAKSGKKVPDGKRQAKPPPQVKQLPSTPPESTSTLECMLVPSPPSPFSTSFILTGSEFLDPVKVRISPKSQERVVKELQEAMSCNFFNVWLTVEDRRPGREAKGEMEESGVFVAKMREGERERREDLMREWKQKGEREVKGRRRLNGKWGQGWESVVEGSVLRDVEEFRPTLGMCFEDGDGMQGVEKLGKEEKSRQSTRRSMKESNTQAMEHQQRRISRAGRGNDNADEEAGIKENHRTQSQSKSKVNQGSERGSSKVPTKRTARFRPWSRDLEDKENSEDEYPFDLKPRKR